MTETSLLAWLVTQLATVPPQGWLYGFLALIALGVGLRFGRQIVRAGSWLLIGGGVLLVLWTLLAQARATERVATAAVTATTGQTVNSIGLTLLAGVLALVVLAAGIVIAVLYWRLRRLERRNTIESRTGESYTPGTALSGSAGLSLVQQLGVLQGMVQALLLQRQAGSDWTALPPAAGYDPGSSGSGSEEFPPVTWGWDDDWMG